VPHVDLSDHVHQLATEDDQIVGVCDFDYSEVDRGLGWAKDSEGMVSMSDCAAALSLVIEHCLQAQSLTLAGAEPAALAVFLNPVHNCKFGRTLSEIAKEAGCTRAALSKSLINFRDAAGVHLSMGKLSGSRRSTERFRSRHWKKARTVRSSERSESLLKRKWAGGARSRCRYADLCRSKPVGHVDLPIIRVTNIKPLDSGPFEKNDD